MHKTILILVAFALALTVVAAQPAGAIVPPRDCGFTKVKGKRYNVRADQLSCKTARRHTTRYLRSRARPRGYKCRDYPSRKRKMKFICEDRPRQFWAIRR